jgi:HK97 family phage major capsid protein
MNVVTKTVAKQQIIDDIASEMPALLAYSRGLRNETAKDLRETAGAYMVENILAGRPTSIEEAVSETLAARHNLMATKMHGLRSFFVPTNSLARALFRAGMLTANDSLSLGQGTIQTGVSKALAPYLRAPSALLQNVTMLENCTGNITLVKQTATTTAAWLPEGTAVTPSNAQFATASTITPYRCHLLTGASGQLLQQSQMDIAKIAVKDMVDNIATQLTWAILQATGADMPTGVFVQAGVPTFTFGSDKTADLLDVKAALKNANVIEDGSLAFVSSPDVEKAFLKTLRAPSTMETLVTDEGTCLGLPFISTSLLGAGSTYKDKLVLAKWSDVVLALFPATEILVDKFTMAASNRVLFHTTVLAGIGYRRLEGLRVSSNAAI